MAELKNYVGGTVDDPCPTGGVFELWAGQYCSYNDYRAWRLRARDLFSQAVQPAYWSYAAAVGAGEEWDDSEDPFFLEVKAYAEAYNKLPLPERWATPDSQRYFVQRAVTLAVLGDDLVSRMQAATANAGGRPAEVSGTSEESGGWELPDFELPDLPDLSDMPDMDWPAVNLDVPWYVWAAGGLGVVVVGAGIYYAVTPSRKRRR